VGTILVGAAVSGFVGIVNFDGAPVDTRLLRDLTNFLSFRGPDAQDVWCDGPVGLGHALLQIPTGAPREKQPAQLDGRLWIVADARIDARAELIGKLDGRSHTPRALSFLTPDAELILHAYDTWGEACVEHLLGDFSFAIWDAKRRRLFCARDHFGVKLFYYARMGDSFLFSNTLDCVRQHPSVSTRLNDLAIADFLLFDANQDFETTTYADVQRLPPAHVLICDHAKPSVRRYWELSVTTPIHYSRDEEYIEHFRELLDAAVADRLRTESAGILMSGGLDSSTVAASAQRIFASTGTVPGLFAYTEVFDRLIPHDERHYARLVADALKIPIVFLPNDDCQLFEHSKQAEYYSTEPAHSALPDVTSNHLRRVADRSRVLLTGDGGDPGFSSRISVHFRQLIQKKQFARAFKDAIQYLTVEGRFSRLYLRTRWRLLTAPKSQSSGYPGWLEETLEKRLGLRDRWESMNRAVLPTAAVRPEAHESFADSTWPSFFEGYEPGFTRIPVEVRYPFFDLRLLTFLLALPRLPWCSDKALLRMTGRGVLPDAVRLRRKTPLQAAPLIVLLRRPEAAWVDQFEPVPELAKYVVRDRIPAVHGETQSWAAWTNLRPLSLNFWLRGRTG
jgi:asparagine synthase (glutamine-hydrolysing)